MKVTFKTALPLAALILMASCGKKDDAASAAAMQNKPMSLPVTQVATKTITAYTSYPATIEGVINSEVRAKIAGYITDVYVDEGQKVRKGEALFKLETQSLDQDAAAARANVNAAQVEVNKLKPLVDKNIISDVQLKTAQAKLQQARSGYSGIAANIGYGTIRSAIDGYVGAIRLRKGALVSPANVDAITTVSQISSVYAYFSMNESDYLDFLQSTEGESKEAKIKNFPLVTLMLVNGTEYNKKGKIETINSQINSNTGTVSFRAKFDNSEGLLTNGNSGTIKVPKVYKDAIVVPQGSTFEQQGSIFVYKVSKDNTALAQAIEIKGTSDNLYIVKSGIGSGETIVATGVGKLRNEMKIQPVMTPFDSIAKPIVKEFQTTSK